MLMWGSVSCACRTDYRLIMGLYALVLGVWIPLNFWMMPWHALRIGQVGLGH